MIQNDDLDAVIETMNVTLSDQYTGFGNISVSSSTLSPYIFSTDSTTSYSNGLHLTDGADIKIGNVSLMDTLNTINSRLAILQVNPELEERWSELKELGDRYRELEKEIVGKEKVWNILKK
jgi:hypothetical protein